MFFKKIPLKGGDEQDALSTWRKVYKYLDRAGQAKKAKKSYNRRFRRLSKMHIKELVHEDSEGYFS